MKKQAKSEIVVPLRIVLVDPPAGVDFGIQEGKGNDYKTIQVQKSKASDLHFECRITVKNNREDGPPNFAGSIVQGPPMGRFIYIDIGKSAGQIDSCWQRRIKIPCPRKSLACQSCFHRHGVGGELRRFATPKQLTAAWRVTRVHRLQGYKGPPIQALRPLAVNSASGARQL